MHTGHTGGPPRLTQLRRDMPAIGLGLLLLGCAAGCWVLSSAQYAGRDSLGGPVAPWWSIAVLAAAAEMVVLHIQVKREAHAISLGEIVLVLGLFFADSPAQFVLGRTFGAAVVFVVWRRQVATKVFFNTALYLAGSTLALLVFGALHGVGQAVTVRAWVAAYAAAVTVGCLDALAVTAVIALADRELRYREAVVELARGVALSAAVTTVALVAVHALHDGARAALPLAAALGMLTAAYRAYSGLSERHLSLERLYRFSHVVSSTPEVDKILAGALQHAQQVLRAEHVQILFLPSDQQEPVLVRCDDQDRLHRTPFASVNLQDPVWSSAAAGQTLLLSRGTRSPVHAAFLSGQLLRDAVIAPLRTAVGVVGIILVGNRMGEVRSFDTGDIRLLETVANHSSMALQNTELLDRLRQDALHDPLTGLGNRAMLQEQLRRALAKVRTDDQAVGLAVMLLDLNGFKAVNDTYGHAAGDLQLIEVARRLVQAAGPAAMIARLGGDEFVVLQPDIPDSRAATDSAAALLNALHLPFCVDGLELPIRGSLGVTVALRSVAGLDPLTLLRQADVAMYEAKQAKKGISLYRPATVGKLEAPGVELVHELRAGIAAGHLELHVQPQADLRTGEISGVEGLVRWRHPQRGLLQPDAFIDLAERSGLIRPLTSAVLTQAVSACAGWAAGGHPLGVAVNLSVRTLLDDDLPGEIAELLAAHRLSPDQLTLEITETSIMTDPTRSTQLLSALHRTGVRLSLDDFGTGYSSLAHLQRLPLHELKIDRAFVMAMNDDAGAQIIVRSIADLARNLGLKVVAEGVESQEGWDRLRALGIATAQGYHLARPMPLDRLPGWLHDYRRRQAGCSPAPGHSVVRCEAIPCTG